MFMQTMLFPGVLEILDRNGIVALFHSATATTVADEEPRCHDSHTLIQRLART